MDSVKVEITHTPEEFSVELFEDDYSFANKFPEQHTVKHIPTFMFKDYLYAEQLLKNLTRQIMNYREPYSASTQCIQCGKPVEQDCHSDVAGQCNACYDWNNNTELSSSTQKQQSGESL